MSSVLDDEEPINVHTADALESVFQENKRNRRLGKGKKKVDYDEPLEAPEKKTRTRQKKTVDAPIPAPAYDEPMLDGEDLDLENLGFEIDIAEIVRKCRMITEYYASFPDVATKRKWNPDKVSEEACDIELARIRNVRDMKGARKAFNAAFVSSFTLVEKFTHEYGVNPLDLEVHGISSAVGANLAKFETELTEAYIELGSHFATSWHWRLAYKCVEFTQAYSALQKDPELRKRVQEAIQKAQEAAASGQTVAPD